ncbi:MAG: hypothetical protein U5L00_06145 [Desulfovermiculus sp.]|nr:hypothetical protein [Desulfovermiculus sp.]
MAEDVARELGPEVRFRVLSIDSDEARSLGIKSAISVYVNGQKIRIKNVLEHNVFEQIICSHLVKLKNRKSQ